MKNKSSNQKEVRQINTAELRAIDNENGGVTIRGYASVYDELSHDLGGFREKIDKEAFRNVLASPELNCVCLLNHDQNIIFARSSNGSLKLSSDKTGLISEWEMPNTQAAKDTAELVRSGIISQMSFGFFVGKDSWEQRNKGEYIRTIQEVKKLVDVSLVSNPAYPQTSAAIRSLDDYIMAEKPNTRENKARLTILKLGKK